MQAAIQAEAIGKQYRIQKGNPRATYKTLRETIEDIAMTPIRRLRGERPAPREEFWALNDVSFDLPEGEVTGIIGDNGAGKSTLLKVLSRITRPTKGRVAIRGRIGSLLEVGTGFHAELSGRENIYLNGAILGMSRNEITRKFEQIVEFAEVAKFIDTPVKRYSSGMYVRLAFAVAAHLEPEILLIDEVLAVGDVAFQKKCMGVMGDAARSGRTIVFVSHNMASVQNLCKKVLWLKKGQVASFGDTDAVIRSYVSAHDSSRAAQYDLQSHPGRRSSYEPLIRSLRFLDDEGRPKECFLCGEPLTIELGIKMQRTVSDPMIQVGIEDWMGNRLFTVGNQFSATPIDRIGPMSSVRCTLASLPVVPGRYSITLSIGNAHDRTLDAIEHAAFLDIEAGDYFGNGQLPSPNLGRLLVPSVWQRVA